MVPQQRASLSLGGFYKHFDNPIEVVVRPGTELIVSVANVPVAHSAGVEFDFRTSFGLGAPLPERLVSFRECVLRL